MNWNEFLQKLTDARKQKKDKKISVPAIATLIYSGAFDSMVDDKPNLALYHKMFEDIKKVKKSKAKLPTKKAGEFIGLDEVKSEIQLTVWRTQKSPIVKKVEFESEISGPLQAHGYVPVSNKNSVYTFCRGSSKDGSCPVTYATPYWSQVFDPVRFGNFESNKMRLFIYGIVTEVSLRMYGPKKDKEMLVFKLFTGKETTDDIVAWPMKNEDGVSLGVSEVFKNAIQPGRIIGGCVKPSLYKGRQTATLLTILHLNL